MTTTQNNKFPLRHLHTETSQQLPFFMMQVVQILFIFLFFLFIFLIGVSRHFRVKIIISWLYTTMAPIFAAARESYLPESFRKVDDNNPFFSLSPPMLRVSEASLDIGLYSNNNLCNYVYVWVHALASLVSFLPSYACRANVSLSLSLSRLLRLLPIISEEGENFLSRLRRPSLL